MSEFKGTKWSLGGISGRMIKTNKYSGFVADVDTKENALLISKAPEMLSELEETVKDLLCIQGSIYDSSRIDARWEGVYDIIQKQIDRKKQLIKQATKI